MAEAKKCDKCKKYYDKNVKFSSGGVAIVGISFTRKDGYKTNYMDLCDECLTKCRQFLDGAELIAETEKREAPIEAIREQESVIQN